MRRSLAASVRRWPPAASKPLFRPARRSPPGTRDSRPFPHQLRPRCAPWSGSVAARIWSCVDPAALGKTFFLEALGQTAVEAGLKVAWFSLEELGVLVRRHRADDSVTKAGARHPARQTDRR